MNMRRFHPYLSVIALTVCSPAFANNEDGSYTLQNAPVQSEIAMLCAFENKCLDAEACNNTTFSLELKGRAGGLNDVDIVVQAELISEIGDTILLGARSGEAMSLSGGTFDARHLLTIANDGYARYTMHYSDGPIAISYLGACS